MNLLMQEMIRMAVVENGGIYAGNQVNSIAPFTFRSVSAAGAWSNIPGNGNTLYYGYLRSHQSDDTSFCKVAVTLSGTILNLYSSVDSKPMLFDGVVPDNAGANTMNAPLSFIGFRIEVPGAGVLP